MLTLHGDSMATSVNKIILEILEFIYRKGGEAKTWHIGVSSEPSQRLFEAHKMRYQNDAWIHRIATTESEALQVQSYFLEFGLADTKEEWHPGACAVYVYRKNMEPCRKNRLLIAQRGIKRNILRHGSVFPVTQKNNAL